MNHEVQVYKAEFQEAYNEESFWAKVAELAKLAKKAAKKTAKELIEKALWLYYAAQTPGVPEKAKYVVYGALGYLILPIDAIPDFLPGVGYVDDLGVVTVAVILIAFHITPEVKRQAAEKMADIFGDLFTE